MIVKGTSGNVGIGTTNPTVAAGMGLVINGGATSPRIALKNNASGDASTDGFQLVLTTENEAVLENRENASMRFLTNATEAMRITGGGNVLIGTTTDNGNKLEIQTNATSAGLWVQTGGTNSSFVVADFRTGTNASVLQLLGNNSVNLSSLAGTGSRAVLADASGVLSAPVSDSSVKENIKTLEYGINDIMKLKPVSFEYIKSYKNYGQGKQIGNIAQDVAKVIPEAVFTTPSTGKMGINYDQLNGVYIKALQELQAQIQDLKQQLANK
jgi:hypothetical protein